MSEHGRYCSKVIVLAKVSTASCLQASSLDLVGKKENNIQLVCQAVRGFIERCLVETCNLEPNPPHSFTSCDLLKDITALSFFLKMHSGHLRTVDLSIKVLLRARQVCSTCLSFK